MLKFNEPNAIEVQGLRRLYHLPPHFDSVTFNLYVHEKDVTDWIYENLNSRFYVGPFAQKDMQNIGSREMTHIAGFEENSEASYFALLMDTFNSSKITY
jgi:hypothetical protein